MAERDAAWPETSATRVHGAAGHDTPARKGKAAIASKAENHTAKRARESRRRAALRITPAKIAINVPSSRQSTIRSVDAWATVLSWKVASGKVISKIMAGSLAPFQ